MPKYPRVNYIGNKEKLAGWIIGELPVASGTVLDLFAGGCSVSYALKKKGYAVISNDILYADYILGKALIENDRCTLKPSVFDIQPQKEREEKLEKQFSFLSERLYYSREVKELAHLAAVAEELCEEERYLFLALIRRAMIRKLPYSRMNVPWDQIKLLRNEAYSYEKYGRKRAYHNQTFESHMRENFEDYNRAVFTGQRKCTVFNCDAMELADKTDFVDVVYLDPPYPSTMNNYDAFYGLFDNMFQAGKKHADFTRRDCFLENLEELIRKLRGKTDYIVLSQNTRVRPEPEIIARMLGNYGQVSVREKKHNYQVTGKQNKNGSKELLFVVRMN